MSTCAVMVLCEAPALCTPRTISIWVSINYVVPIVDVVWQKLGVFMSSSRVVRLTNFNYLNRCDNFHVSASVRPTEGLTCV